MTMMGKDQSGVGAMRRAAIAIAVFLVLAGLLFLFGPDDFYPWAKAIHVIAVISWMAGMLYLPRLYVYHAQVGRKSAESDLLKVMERPADFSPSIARAVQARPR